MKVVVKILLVPKLWGCGIGLREMDGLCTCRESSLVMRHYWSKNLSGVLVGEGGEVPFSPGPPAARVMGLLQLYSQVFRRWLSPWPLVSSAKVAAEHPLGASGINQSEKESVWGQDEWKSS